MQLNWLVDRSICNIDLKLASCYLDRKMQFLCDPKFQNFFIPTSCVAKDHYFPLICVIISVTGAGNPPDDHYVWLTFYRRKNWILAWYIWTNIYGIMSDERWAQHPIKGRIHSFKKDSNFAGIIPNLKKNYKIKRKENKWRKTKSKLVICSLEFLNYSKWL